MIGLLITAFLFGITYAFGIVTLNDQYDVLNFLGALAAVLIMLWAKRREIAAKWTQKRGLPAGAAPQPTPAPPSGSAALRRCLDVVQAHIPAQERQPMLVTVFAQIPATPDPAFQFMYALSRNFVRPGAPRFIRFEGEPDPVWTPDTNLFDDMHLWVSSLTAFRGITEVFQWSFPDRSRASTIAALRGLSDQFASHGRTLMHFDIDADSPGAEQGLPALVVITAALAPALTAAAADAGFLLATAEEYWASPQGERKLRRAGQTPPQEAVVLAREGRDVVVQPDPDRTAPAEVITSSKVGRAAHWLAKAAELYDDPSTGYFDRGRYARQREDPAVDHRTTTVQRLPADGHQGCGSAGPAPRRVNPVAGGLPRGALRPGRRVGQSSDRGSDGCRMPLGRDAACARDHRRAGHDRSRRRCCCG